MKEGSVGEDEDMKKYVLQQIFFTTTGDIIVMMVVGGGWGKKKMENEKRIGAVFVLFFSLGDGAIYNDQDPRHYLSEI
jgi:hypothetical protein